MTSVGAAWASRFAAPLIVPMTLHCELLGALRISLTRQPCRVLHVCLVAPCDTVFARLAHRGVTADSEEGRWVYPRAARACAEHLSGAFEHRIDTEGRSVDVVVDAVVRAIERSRLG